MAHLIWSPDAINDLDIISNYISLDSERYASVVVTRIISLAEEIVAFPMSGRIVPELEEENVREKFYKKETSMISKSGCLFLVTSYNKISTLQATGALGLESFSLKLATPHSPTESARLHQEKHF
jgi:plasmid stabilization system protein ParE